MKRRLSALLLRTPLHGLVSKHTLLLAVGSTSVVLPFSRNDGTLTVLGTPGQTWWTALDKDEPTPVEVRLVGTTRQGRARFVAGDELDDALLPYLHDHPGAWRDMAVPPDATSDDVAAAAQQVAVVVIDLDAG